MGVQIKSEYGTYYTHDEELHYECTEDKRRFMTLIDKHYGSVFHVARIGNLLSEQGGEYERGTFYIWYNEGAKVIPGNEIERIRPQGRKYRFPERNKQSDPREGFNTRNQ